MNVPMPDILGENLDPRNVAKAIEICKAYNSEHHIPLFQAAAVGRIAMTALTNRLSRPNINALRKSKRPALILVGDDEGSTTGPLGWVASTQLVQWARGAIVHGTGADPQNYAMAVAMAEMLGRVVLVETTSDAAEAWWGAFERAGVPGVAIIPPNGDAHPIEPEQGIAA